MVGIIFSVASRTIRVSRLQICNAASAGMTRSAVQSPMFPSQLEGNVGMLEGMTVAINPIVATQASISIGRHVRLHKISFDLLVTSDTNGLVEFGIAALVAGITNKWRTIRLFLVGSERVPEYVVRCIDHG